MKKVLIYINMVLLIFVSASVSFGQNMVYSLEKKIAIPGNAGYDYLSIDTLNNRLFISHGTSVVVLDLKTDQIVGTIEHLAGVHGIAIAPEFQKGFISDGKANSVMVFDLQSLKTIKTILITGKDPDAILYDPFSRQVFTFNGDSQDASVIDVARLAQTGSVTLGGAPEFAVSDGEGKIYNNIEDKNQIVVIDTKTLQVMNRFPLDPCGGPTGLALDKMHQRLFTVCRKNKGMTVVEIPSGKPVATLPIGAGVDAVSYDAVSGTIICSNGDGTATIIHQDNANHYTVLQTLATQWKAKTHAMDPNTKKLYFSAFDTEEHNRNRIPDSFQVLVYKLK